VIEQFRNYRAADLLIAGDGEEAPSLHRQAAGLSHVRFLGRVHPSALPQLYARAVATIVPSVGYETFGMITLESFAQHTPVLVRDLGGLPEVVRESDGGFVYNDDNDLVPLMESLRTNPTLRRELGERGHTAYVRSWSEEPHLTAYFAAIEEARTRRSARVAAEAKVTGSRCAPVSSAQSAQASRHRQSGLPA
jgi:glycosyltransferase involved in cell wall biosynthesis